MSSNNDFSLFQSVGSISAEPRRLPRLMIRIFSSDLSKAMGKAAPALGSVKQVYADVPKPPKKEKQRTINLDTAPQFAGKPQLAEKGVSKDDDETTKKSMIDAMIESQIRKS